VERHPDINSTSKKTELPCTLKSFYSQFGIPQPISGNVPFGPSTVSEELDLDYPIDANLLLGFVRRGLFLARYENLSLYLEAGPILSGMGDLPSVKSRTWTTQRPHVKDPT
jgi:hypothetical protein